MLGPIKVLSWNCGSLPSFVELVRFHNPGMVFSLRFWHNQGEGELKKFVEELVLAVLFL